MKNDTSLSNSYPSLTLPESPTSSPSNMVVKHIESYEEFQQVACLNIFSRAVHPLTGYFEYTDQQ